VREYYKPILFVFILFIVMGCAGPTNPLGHYGTQMPSTHSELPINLRSVAMGEEESRAQIEFYPQTQDFNRTRNLTIRITDPEGIPKGADYSLFYNETNVTDSWLSKSNISRSNNDKTITITFNGLKLLAQRNHDIVFTYKRNPYTSGLTQTYENPTCHMADLEPLGEDRLLNRIPKNVRNAVEEIATDEGVNPAMVAGLIAQESAFNPMAVSSAKAIGLTQVTALAGKHVLATYKDFPTYPNLNEYSVPMIKTLIITGEVNQENEWRLNPMTSIQGGIHYLKFVENYWLKKSHRKILLKHYKDEDEILDDLILASYNSGPYRVKKALTKQGTAWLESQNLGEARKYVRKVKSYCYHFAANKVSQK
jgi:hypothetical protein